MQQTSKDLPAVDEHTLCMPPLELNRGPRYAIKLKQFYRVQLYK